MKICKPYMCKVKVIFGNEIKNVTPITLILLGILILNCKWYVIKASTIDIEQIISNELNQNDSVVNHWVEQYKELWESKDLQALSKLYEDQPMITGSMLNKPLPLYYKKCDKNDFINYVKRCAENHSATMKIDKVEIHKHPRNESIFGININHSIEDSKAKEKDAFEKSKPTITYKAYAFLVVDLTYPEYPRILYSNVMNDPNELIKLEDILLE